MSVYNADDIFRYISIEISEAAPSCVKMLVPFSSDQASAQSLLNSFANIIKSMAEIDKYLVSEVSLPNSLV